MGESDAAAEAAPAGPEVVVEVAPVASPSPEQDDEGTDKDAKENKEGKQKKEKKDKKEKKEKTGLNLPAHLKSQTMGALQNEELDWIWIGNADDARDCVALRKHDVKYILNCTQPRNNGGVSNYHEKDPNFTYCRLAMGDNSTERLATRFQTAWDFFEKVRVREDGGVLVHCQQGVSRSVSMVICYLMKYYRWTYDDALKLCRKTRAQAGPNEGFEGQLREFEEELRKTNAYEKTPPPRKKRQLEVGAPAGAAKRPNVGPARGPAGPARGPAGAAPGPARGPVGPAVGPAGPPAGPSVGPSVGPAVGPGVGPAMPEKVKDKKDKKEKKEKKEKVDDDDKDFSRSSSSAHPKELRPLNAPPPGAGIVSEDALPSMRDGSKRSFVESDADTPDNAGTAGVGITGAPPAASAAAAAVAAAGAPSSQAGGGDRLQQGKQQIDADIQEQLRKYREEKEAEERKKMEKEFEAWKTAEEWKAEEDRNKKAKEIEAESKTKLAKLRKEMEQEAEIDRDKVFGEMHEKNEKAIREERQRLQQELAAKKRSMGEEISAEAASDDELRKRLAALEAENERLQQALKDEKAAADARVQTAMDNSKSIHTECDRLRDALEQSEVESGRELKRLKQDLKKTEEERDRSRFDGEALTVKIETMTEELERLKKENTSKTEESSRLQEELSKQGGEAGASALESVRMKTQLQEKTSDVERLEKKVKQLESDVQSMSGSVAQSVEEADRLQRFLEEKSSECETLRAAAKSEDSPAELATLRKENAQLNTDLEKTQQALQKQRDLLQERCIEFQRLLEEAESKEGGASDADLAKLRREHAEELERLQDAASTKQAKREKALREELEVSKVQDMAGLNEKMARLQEELEKSEAAVLRAEMERDAYSDRATEQQKLKQERETLQQEIRQLQASLSAAKEDASKASAVNARATAEELQALQERLDAETKAAMEARATATAKQRDSDRLQGDLEQARRECDRLRAQGDQGSLVMKDELQRVEAQLAQERSAAADARSEASTLSRELAMQKAELDVKKSECDRLQARSADSASSLQDEMQRLQKQLAEERASSIQARSDASASSRDLTITRAELDAKLAECKRLQSKVAESNGVTFEDFKRVQAQLEDERRNSTKTMAEAKGLSMEMTSLKAELDARTHECSRLTSDAALGATAQEDVRRLQAQLEESQSAIVQAKIDGSSSQRELSTLRAEVEAKNQQLARLRAEMTGGAGSPTSPISEGLTRGLQRQLEEERAAATQARLEASAANRELAALRGELDAKTADNARLQVEVAGEAQAKHVQLMSQLEDEQCKVRRLQAQYDEEKARVTQQQSAAERTAAKAASQNSALQAELDARSAECGRLRAELLQHAGSSQPETDARQMAALRGQLAESKAELERLREQTRAQATSPVMSQEEERLLRSMIRDRDDTILDLKAAAAQTMAAHARDVEDLQAKLSDARLRERRSQAEATAERVTDLHAQLRSRASEIERLHGELRASAAEVERARSEAQASASAVSAAEAAKSAAMEQAKREVQRLEDIAREKDTEISNMREQAERSRVQMLQREGDEHRLSKKAENAQSEVEHVRQEANQLRDQISELERRLEDARSTFRVEHLARNTAEGQARESQRELRTIRDQLQQQGQENELVSSETRKYRAEVADRDLEVSRLQQKINVLEAELRQIRSQKDSQLQTSDNAVRRAMAEVGERESLLVDREQAVKDRERMVVDQERLLNDKRREMRVQQQRTDLEHMKTMSTLAMTTGQSPTSALAATMSRAAAAGAAAAALNSSMAVDGTLRPEGVEAADRAIETGSCAAPVSEQAELEHEADIGLVGTPTATRHGGASFGGSPRPPQGTIGLPMESMDAGLTNRLADSATPAMAEAAMALEARRRELRRERNELEELRRHWRKDFQKVQSVGVGPQVHQMLRDVRHALDDRAVALNQAIEELRTLERALSLSGAAAQVAGITAYEPEPLLDNGGGGGYPLSSTQKRTSSTPRPASYMGSLEAADLQRRWNRVLDTGLGTTLTPRSSRAAAGMTSIGLSPGRRSSSTDRHSSRRCRQAQDVVEHHMHFLRGLMKDPLNGA
eukprot:TRINITY_DN4181_c0_g2_i1.p1 TRINITY_DN4181_c0_g2~~TRINITY_DN4181_c0_g2_i1.p1  ORF type:complete len:2085 (-),score=719.12 TRINITY_DN4181_c0_g2_i1:212-6466(-)